MGIERLRRIRDLQALAPLSDHTDAIQVNEHGKVIVNNRLNAPNDEFGIPRPEIMVEQLLGQMGTKNYVWTGAFDEHHLATPKADFTVVRTRTEGDIGSAFRGSACLKIDLPRQMHNFSHALFELPGRPQVDVMRQAVYEIGQAKQIQSIINEHVVGNPEQDNERTQRLCVSALSSFFEKAQEPQVRMLPPLEQLHDMELHTLRNTVNSLLRARRFSAKHLIHPAIRKPSEWSQSRTAA